MSQSAAARGDPYQAAHYNVIASPPPMYSRPPPQPPPYSAQPLQPPPTAAAWGYPPPAAYDAANECKALLQECDDPIAEGADLHPIASGFARQPCTASAFYRALAYILPPQLSVEVEVSKAPLVAIVYQPPPFVTTLGVVKSYLAWSLVSLIILFWPLGIPALIYSLKVRSATTLGDKSKYSLLARNFNIAATVVGPVLIILLAASISSVRTVHYIDYAITLPDTDLLAIPESKSANIDYITTEKTTYSQYVDNDELY